MDFLCQKREPVRLPLYAMQTVSAHSQVYPYVGIIQIRLRVTTIQSNLSLFTQAPLNRFARSSSLLYLHIGLGVKTPKPLVTRIVPCYALPQSFLNSSFRGVSPHFTLIEGRVIKPFSHRHASMSWAQAFDTVNHIVINSSSDVKI